MVLGEVWPSARDITDRFYLANKGSKGAHIARYGILRYPFFRKPPLIALYDKAVDVVQGYWFLKIGIEGTQCCAIVVKSALGPDTRQ